jgi:hypothetical protein
LTAFFVPHKVRPSGCLRQSIFLPIRSVGWRSFGRSRAVHGPTETLPSVGRSQTLRPTDCQRVPGCSVRSSLRRRPLTPLRSVSAACSLRLKFVSHFAAKAVPTSRRSPRHIVPRPLTPLRSVPASCSLRLNLCATSRKGRGLRKKLRATAPPPCFRSFLAHASKLRATAPASGSFLTPCLRPTARQGALGERIEFVFSCRRCLSARAVRLRSRRLKRNLFDARPLLSCFAGSAGCLRFAPVNACASRRGSPRDPPSLSGGWLGRRSAKAEPVLATCQGGNLIGLGVRPNRVESKRRWEPGVVGWASIVWP